MDNLKVFWDYIYLLGKSNLNFYVMVRNGCVRCHVHPCYLNSQLFMLRVTSCGMNKLRISFMSVYMCQGLNSHDFHNIGDKLINIINPIVGGLYTHYNKDSLLKVGWVYPPKKGSFDHGTNMVSLHFCGAEKSLTALLTLTLEVVGPKSTINKK